MKNPDRNRAGANPTCSIVPGQRGNKNAPLSLGELSSRRYSIKRSLVIPPAIKKRTADTMANEVVGEERRNAFSPR